MSAFHWREEMSLEKELEENLEKISNEIKKLQVVGEALSKSELNEKTIIWLLSRASGVSQTDVRKIMDTLFELESIFLKRENQQ